jgi:hypothetical protein
LAGLAAASAAGTLAVGGAPGWRPERLGQAGGTGGGVGSDAPHARWEGFDLHAGVAVPAGHRARLERVCRYALRPPVTGERVSVDADGQVVLHLRHPWADGTTHLRFGPTAFLERLAVLVPRPRVNLVLYFGVLARMRLGGPRWCLGEGPAQRVARARSPAPGGHPQPVPCATAGPS